MWMGKTKKRPIRKAKGQIKKPEYVLPESMKCPKCNRNTIRQKLSVRVNYPFGTHSKRRLSIKKKYVWCVGGLYSPKPKFKDKEQKKPKKKKEICGYSNTFHSPEVSQHDLLEIV